ncbi:MAG: hypothetical protein R6W69_13795, partial [Anaerolineales bacterium]
ANIYADLLRQVWNIYKQNGDAIEAQEDLDKRRKILDPYKPFPPIVKALVTRKFGFPRWPVKPPLLDVPDEIVDKVWQELSKLDNE